MSALMGSASTLSPSEVISGFTFVATINSTLSSYDVATAATAAGWNGTAIITATITQASSGEITGPFTTGVLPADSTVALTIESTAFTRGSGGTGGDGGFTAGEGSSGTAGGTAISFLSDGSVTIDSGGEVSGGAGGGGGGGGFLDPVTEKEGNGGGGGGGFPDGAGGIGLLGATNGAAGTSGGGGSAGTGDNGGGNGGNGGAAATAGVAGSSGSEDGGAGGAAGSAIEKNGFTVTVNNSGTLNGDVNG